MNEKEYKNEWSFRFSYGVARLVFRVLYFSLAFPKNYWRELKRHRSKAFFKQN